MAEIFKRQNRCSELERLWEKPPNTSLRQIILDRHRDDLNAVMLRALLEREDWPLLERHCQDVVTKTISNSQAAAEAKSGVWELCAWRSDVWNGLMKAVTMNRPSHQ